MNEKLLAFINKHIKRGIDADRIKEYLLGIGYDIKIIEDHSVYGAVV